MKTPNTPFSTRLSGSAKETELRIRSIFQWKKKRPPVIVIVLAAVLVLLCFGLFGFRGAGQPEHQTLYDIHREFIDITWKSRVAKISYWNTDHGFYEYTDGDDGIADVEDFFKSVQLGSSVNRRKYMKEDDKGYHIFNVYAGGGGRLKIKFFRDDSVVLVGSWEQNESASNFADDAKAYRLPDGVDQDAILTLLYSAAEDKDSEEPLPPAVDEGDPSTVLAAVGAWQGEPIAFPDGNLTIVPPESWAGKAAYQISENEVYFYLLSTSIETGYEGAGHLCTVKYLPGEFYPLNYYFPWPGETIAMTADGTYVYWTPSDVQFTPKTQEEYTALYSQVHEIQFVLSDWLAQNSMNAQNPDVPELTTAARKGLAMAVMEDTVMTNCYSYTYFDPADVAAYGWYRSGDDHRLAAGDVVLVLEEEDGMSRVMIPYGDIPRLYGFVDSDLLSGDKPDVYAAVGHVNQAIIAYEIPGYAAPGGGTPVTTLVPCTVQWLELQNGWAKVQPLVGGEDPCWVDSSHLYFGFGDEEVVDVPTGLNFFS